LEVRQEIGELKCEFIEVRGLAIELAASLIKEQTQKVKYLFDQRSESDIENRKRQEIICQFAVSAIKEQTQKVKYLFDQRNETDIEIRKRQELICSFAASIIRTQAILIVN
jgi:hypothetical protein